MTDSETTPQSVTSGWLSITVSGPAVTGVRPHVGPAFGHTPVRITGSDLSCPRFDPFCRVSATFGGVHSQAHPADHFTYVLFPFI